MKRAVEIANHVRKALLAAAAVATTITVTEGFPTEAVEGSKVVLAVLAVFGIVYRVANKPLPAAE
jgi:hypothetical protein